MPPSRLDAIYRRLLITKFFEKGWGKPENLRRLFEFRKFVSNRESCFKLVPNDYPVEITKEEKTSECTIIEGKFMTPLELHLPGLVPKASQQAHFQMLLPNKWRDPIHKPVCLHLAGTGDHYYWRRRNFIAKPLLRDAGLGAIILENPFYGVRKPKDQVRSNLHNVSDIFVMGGCLVLECMVLMHWCERNGFGPLGITGLSMGGHMASLAATNWPKPIVLVPCLSWSSASAVFTTGVMSQSINWDMLETQYFADGQYRERLAKMVTVIDEAFMAGQHFVKNYPKSIKDLQQDLKVANNLRTSTTQSPSDQNTNPHIIKLDRTNSLQLSETLQNKLMSTERYGLTNSEVNELNEKIRSIQCKIRTEMQHGDFLKHPTQISTETLVNTSEAAIASSPADKLSQLPAANPSKSTELSTLTELMYTILPKTPAAVAARQAEKIDITKTKWWEREALQFMRGMMDECTHLKNFSVPYDTSLIIAVCAKDDAYVPRDGCTSLEDIWPGAEVRYLDAGHVSAYVLHQKLFRSCIIEAFERAKRKREENMLTSEPIPSGSLSYDDLQRRYLDQIEYYV